VIDNYSALAYRKRLTGCTIVIRSMTGYGRKEASGDAGHFTIEIRSVNNRYIDVQVKVPRGLSLLELRVKKTVQERCSRGRFDVLVTRNNDREKATRLVIDEVLAAQYVGLLRDLKMRYGLAGEVDLSLVAGMQNIITMTEVSEDMETIWSLLAEGLDAALTELDRMRLDEGVALVRDITGRINAIEGMARAIGAQSPQSVEKARKRMADTLAKLLQEQPDPVRLAQEIAILAERTDVTEELTRLDSHLGQFRAMLAGGPEAVGRKLDFLLQEMGREVNTIASKCQDAAISLDVVQCKAELEKIREQVQNIE
jgi:uncharacterized protein (TIGR00255 family)